MAYRELAFCGAQVRRNFYELQAGHTPAADRQRGAPARIAGLHAVEADIRGQTAEQRRQVRQPCSTPILEALKPWLGRTHPGIGQVQHRRRDPLCLSRWKTEPASSTTAASGSTATSSGQAARTICSPAATAAPDAGR